MGLPPLLRDAACALGLRLTSGWNSVRPVEGSQGPWYLARASSMRFLYCDAGGQGFRGSAVAQGMLISRSLTLPCVYPFVYQVFGAIVQSNAGQSARGALCAKS